jgi:DNA adenine methylase
VILKPLIKWAGGKASLIPQIKKHFPTNYNNYIEPFIGGGAVYLSLDNTVSAIINDINPEIANIYHIVKTAPLHLMASLNKLAELYSEEYFYALRKAIPDNPIMIAARTIYLNKTCFNGLYRQNRKGEYNVPFGKRIKCPQLYDKENILAVSQRLQNTTLMNADFEQVIGLANEGDLVYLDPPYYPISPTAKFNSYHKSGFNEKDQIRLYECSKIAHNKGATVIISNSYCDFITDLYKDYEIAIVKARRSINSKGDSREAINESLIIMR